MTLLVAAGVFVGGYATAFATAGAGRRWLHEPPHLRTNYLGHDIPGTMGLVLLAPLVAGAGVGAWWGSRGMVVAGAAAAMGLLGLVDDLYGGGPGGGGFAGHIRALVRGRVTTGLVKAAAGGLVGLAAAWAVGWTLWWTVPAGAVVALSANLINLFDRRPGRAAKVWVAGWMLLLLAGPPADALMVSAAVAGGLLMLLPQELGAKTMLGDAGANLLGTVLGVSAVATLGTVGTLSLLGVLLALNAASELVSFGRVIERVPPLRALDRMGRGSSGQPDGITGGA